MASIEIIISVVLLIVGIAILVVIHVCVVGRTFRGDPRNGRNPASGRIGRIPSMKPEEIMELPCFEYKVDEEKGNRECAVCLENFREGERCRSLPECNHSFHAECIDSWLLKIAACPICRTCAKSSSKFEGSSNNSSEVEVELVCELCHWMQKALSQHQREEQPFHFQSLTG